MSPAVRFVPAARDELREAAAWYEKRRSNLGSRGFDSHGPTSVTCELCWVGHESAMGLPTSSHARRMGSGGPVRKMSERIRISTPMLFSSHSRPGGAMPCQNIGRIVAMVPSTSIHPSARRD